jgi:cell pole-organizing protein PopZ
MVDAKAHNEPSMEEILASIRRIIAEDDPAPSGDGSDSTASSAADPAPGRTSSIPPDSGPQEQILDLTERIDEENLGKPGSGAAHEPEPQFSPSGRLTRPPPLKTGATSGGQSFAPSQKRLVSDSTAAASMATLVQLASLGARERQRELPLGDVGRTLEEMVRELLRPHMKEWLDANLPRLVERLVREEINRLVREAQGH